MEVECVLNEAHSSIESIPVFFVRGVQPVHKMIVYSLADGEGARSDGVGLSKCNVVLFVV